MSDPKYFCTHNDIEYELDHIKLAAKVIKSPKASKNVFIPKFFSYKSKQYIVAAIGERAFELNHQILSLTFDSKSEVITVEGNAFKDSSIAKLQIPPKLKNLTLN